MAVDTEDRLQGIKERVGWVKKAAIKVDIDLRK